MVRFQKDRGDRNRRASTAALSRRRRHKNCSEQGNGKTGFDVSKEENTMEEKEARFSRREALKRMAKASVGVGMGLQLVGVFVPRGLSAAAADPESPRFTTIGHVSSQADTLRGCARPGATRSCGVYTNGGGYTQNGYSQYGKYQNYVNDGNCG